MIGRARALVAALACAVGVGCAARPSADHRAGLAAADRAYRAGRFVEAADAYEGAARRASSPRDASDAHYRAAMACRRAGDLSCAERSLAAAAVLGGEWDHAPRARLELASLRLRSGDPAVVESALVELRALIQEAPDTGPARGALRLALRALDGEHPSARSVAWLEAVASHPRVLASTLIESVLAERASRLEALGDAGAAEAAWRDLLRRVPYPDNSHWDDGHLALARLLRTRGRAREAVEALDQMLAVRERSWGNGSYAAPRFDDGEWLRAEILRDDLREAPGAADAFHRVYAEHPTSLRRDDALWEEASLRRSFDREGACRAWRTLAEEFACRRFAERARAELSGCGVSARPAECAGR